MKAIFIGASAALSIGMMFDSAVAQPGRWDALRDQVFYFVLPDRFQNADRSNDRGGSTADTRDEHGFDPTDRAFYHGGDLLGITARLDYLQKLGVSALWLGPVARNQSTQWNSDSGRFDAGYHGYWTLDFTRVDPHFGSQADFDNLIAASHRAGMRVFLDIITNHTADVIQYRECPQGSACPYRDRARYPYDRQGGLNAPLINPGFGDCDPIAEMPCDPGAFAWLHDMSYAYTPYMPAGREHSKTPEWLNDIHFYHNRGNADFDSHSSRDPASRKESLLAGDFAGLDDLFTEHPMVVLGMIQIYSGWVDRGIDGFRIDTARHVDMPFWQRFIPSILDHALARGQIDFFLFGEVYDIDPLNLFRYMRVARFPAVLDFPYQDRVRAVVADDEPTNLLRQLFVQDDLYTTLDRDAGLLPTFLGNHDMGRIGFFIQQRHPDANQDEWFRRDRLAHALLLLSRGIPIIYYGDEQGFTGHGGDQLARQDMLASRVAEYNDNRLIGTDATTAVSSFDESRPLFRSIASFIHLRRSHPALSHGVQIHRLSENRPGLYVFSRIDRDEQIEYVVALNTSADTRSASVPVFNSGDRFEALALDGAAQYPAQPLVAAEDSKLDITLAPFDVMVLRGSERIGGTAPALALTAHPVTLAGHVYQELCAIPGEGAIGFGSVAFAAVINGSRMAIGTDHAPTTFETEDNTNCPRGVPVYRVLWEMPPLSKGTEAVVSAIFIGSNGTTSSTETRIGGITIENY